MVYDIPKERYEYLLSKLKKKEQKILSKVSAFNEVFKFHHEMLGETEVPTNFGSVSCVRLDIDSKLQFEDWSMCAFITYYDDRCHVAVLDRSYYSLSIPRKYYEVDKYCECCSTLHRRKYMCLLYNSKTGEYKRVCMKCINKYIPGMNQDVILQYVAWHDLITVHSSSVNCILREMKFN